MHPPLLHVNCYDIYDINIIYYYSVRTRQSRGMGVCGQFKEEHYSIFFVFIKEILRIEIGYSDFTTKSEKKSCQLPARFARLQVPTSYQNRKIYE